MFSRKTLLITGGTGSFGNAVVRRFLDTDIDEIRIFSRDEKKQDDMRRELNSNKLRFYLGDVREAAGLMHAMRGVDFVFHAAALKQVPSCEFYPMEAVRTNVVGTENVLDAAIEKGVRRVVVLSTDKAVYPINAMGMSKALMEKVMVAKSRLVDPKVTLLCGTRYGNVMASRGSVIPLFAKQIRDRMPVTVTDPRMTRFMMSLREAVNLVIHAFEHAGQGDIFVKKAPAATIEDIANAMKSIFSAKNDVHIIGTRHGEKLYETLVTREELASAEDTGTYFRIPPDVRDLNYEKYTSEGQPNLPAKDYNSHNTERLSPADLTQKLLDLDYIKQERAHAGGGVEV
jgi:UDP-glucose 4-epimerase